MSGGNWSIIILSLIIQKVQSFGVEALATDMTEHTGIFQKQFLGVGDPKMNIPKEHSKSFFYTITILTVTYQRM